MKNPRINMEAVPSKTIRVLMTDIDARVYGKDRSYNDSLKLQRMIREFSMAQGDAGASPSNATCVLFARKNVTIGCLLIMQDHTVKYSFAPPYSNINYVTMGIVAFTLVSLGILQYYDEGRKISLSLDHEGLRLALSPNLVHDKEIPIHRDAFARLVQELTSPRSAEIGRIRAAGPADEHVVYVSNGAERITIFVASGGSVHNPQISVRNATLPGNYLDTVKILYGCYLVLCVGVPYVMLGSAVIMKHDRQAKLISGHSVFTYSEENINDAADDLLNLLLSEGAIPDVEKEKIV